MRRESIARHFVKPQAKSLGKRGGEVGRVMRRRPGPTIGKVGQYKRRAFQAMGDYQDRPIIRMTALRRSSQVKHRTALDVLAVRRQWHYLARVTRAKSKESRHISRPSSAGILSKSAAPRVIASPSWSHSMA